MTKKILSVHISNDADRVAFALRFANEPLPTTQKQLTELRSLLTEFLGMKKRGPGRREPGGFGIEVNVVRSPQPWEYTLLQMGELQEEARHLIRQAVDVIDPKAPETRGASPTVLSDEQELILDVVGTPNARRLRIGGSVRAGFLLTLGMLLAGVTGAPPVLKCPECSRWFVRVGRQKYCSPKCTDAATWRLYPLEKKLKARKKRYDAEGWTLGARSAKRKAIPEFHDAAKPITKGKQ